MIIEFDIASTDEKKKKVNRQLSGGLFFAVCGRHPVMCDS